ncbi:NAD-dependent epimerase/dehydratase family protein [Desertihabitans brevis]|uniref:NAD-dependent epimerase/dehydratase family protein n=1 Tax=Desertihabitans brevis TaxID=2268447 RepID=A0A367YRA3_9ACTN|nr:NAD-dependent epimerase/dehydratase family protein [Desertihabitans brevis]RCK68330.1 NAD-dependent epimerase/dehydratase family protein [Desertihabitans brevis]
MRIVVVGGSGHVGSFLVPRLVRAGHEVVNLSRGQRTAYVQDEVWQQVEQVLVDRDSEDRAGTFADRVLEQRPDAVVDMVCFTLDSATTLVGRLRGEVGHLVHCGSIWRYGPSRTLPVTEETATPPVGEYGVQKDAIAQMLREETRSGGLVTTSLHPGHISGPGWAPIGPLGNLDPGVWRTLSAGEELTAPGTGSELMHHVHADDVAQAFQLALEHRDAAAGEAFDVVAPSALTVRGYAEAAAGWFGQQARLRTTSWEEFRAATPAEHADASWEHLWRSHYVSIDKTRAVLGYTPRHEPDAAALEAVRWLVEHGRLDVAGPLVV